MMLNFKRVLILILFVIGLFFSCDQDDQVSKQNVEVLIQKSLYKNDSIGISFNYPLNWERLDNYNGTLVAVVNNKENNPFKENISLTVNQIDQNIADDDFLRSCINDIVRVSKTDSVKRHNTYINEMKVCKLNIAVSPKGEKLDVTVYIFIKDHKSYILTCYCEEKSSEYYQKLFEEVAHSLKIVGSPHSA